MRPLLVIDLDGTLLETNTFRDYLAFCGRCATHAFRWDLSLCIFLWVMLRKLRFITHAQMKRQLMTHTATFMQRKSRLDDFVEEELLLTNQRVKTEVERYRNRGYLLLLSTAAPALYAKAIADDFKLDGCLATPLPAEVVMGEWHEHVGEEKVRSLQQYLQRHEAKLDTVISDHADDLPLLRLNAEGRNLLVNPSAKTESLLAKEEIKYEKMVW